MSDDQTRRPSKPNLPAVVVSGDRRPSGTHAAIGSDHRPSRPNLPAVTMQFGNLLVREKMVTPSQLEHALVHAQQTDRHLYFALTQLGVLTSLQLRDFFSKHFGVPTVDLNEMHVPEMNVLNKLTRAMCIQHMVVPIGLNGRQQLIVAMMDPGNIVAVQEMEFKCGKIDRVVALREEIEDAIDRFYPQEQELTFPADLRDEVERAELTPMSEEETDAAAMQAASTEAPIVRLVNLILIDAVKRRASDIHFETYETECRVRYRIDGTLIEVMKIPMKMRKAVISRIKIMSTLDISETRKPQDGRMVLKYERKQIQFRVSVTPCLFGEKIVARLLDKGSLQTDMTQLGFDARELALFRQAIHESNGLVLVTGPTGSGKTTTLYSALTELNNVSRNVSSAENPVEYDLHGINQVQVNEAIGVSFPETLRSFLRQDPDVIMVGEIRDFETAEIAIKASQTGHLVLSTLHTNNAPSTIGRLLHMGIETFMLADSLNLVAAQRLVKRVCTECKKPHAPDKQAVLAAGMSEEDFAKATFMMGTGCRFCEKTGMRTRIAIYEIMVVSDAMKDAIIEGVKPGDLKRLAIAEGMQTLRQSALKKLAAGLTTLDEVLRVTRAD